MRAFRNQMTRTIGDIYEKYQIPPWLAEHMLRVAAVASVVFDAAKEVSPELDGRDDLIAACLVHDLGNIIKFDFERLPPPDGQTEYWEMIKDGMIERYGRNEIVATVLMIGEIGIAERVRPVLENTSDHEAILLLEEGTLLQKIAYYADQRVSPRGVLPLRDRLRDMRERYSHPDDERTRALDAATERIEEVLFEGLSLRPEDITDESVAPMIESLKSFEI